MNRREALKNVAFLMGGTILCSQTFLTSCAFDREAEITGDGKTYSEKDIALMNEIGETIIPTTDTPGAKATGIGKFMVVMVNDCYDEENRIAFRKGLDMIHENFKEEFGKPFVEATPEEHTRFLIGLEKEMAAYYSNKKPEQPDHYYRILKELTLLGYFTSEIGCNQALNYIQTPGAYKACIPYEGGKAWATS